MRTNKMLTQIFAVESSFLFCQIKSLHSKVTYSVVPLKSVPPADVPEKSNLSLLILSMTLFSIVSFFSPVI